MNTYPNTLDDLVVDNETNPDKYKHIQFILSRKRNMDLGLGQFYLVVNETGFGVYRLDDVNYENRIIRMLFTNPVTANVSEITVDIRNKHPQVYLVNWIDIVEMVYADIASNYTNNELNELGNELP